MIRDADAAELARKPIDLRGRAVTRDGADGDAGRVLPALRGTSAADRFCAWKGRAAHRAIFSVFPLGPDITIDDLPLDAGAVVLGVRRTREGVRRVLWSCTVGAVRRPAALAAALASLAAADGGEVHLHLLAVGDAARARIVTDLGFPLLAAPFATPATGEPPWPQVVAMALGASMNPPDWRRQRSA